MTQATDPRERAAAARLARSEQIYALRMRVVAIAVGLFLALWAGIFVQLISGRDPALANAAATVSSQSTGQQIATDKQGGIDDAWPAGDEASDEGSLSSSAPPAVSTRQS